MKFKNLYLKSFMVTLILILIATVIISPQLGLAQESEPSDEHGPEQAESSSAEQPTSLEDHPLGVLFEGDTANQATPQADAGDPILSEFDNFDASRGDSNSNTIILEGREAERDMPGGTRAPGVLVIPSADFRSDGISPTSYTFAFSGGYFIGGASNSCLIAPAYLPQGAAIKEIWATVLDNATNQFVEVRLFQLDNFTGSLTQITNFGTLNAFQSPSLQTIGSTGLNTSVVYPTFSYYVAACLTGSSTRLYSVRVYYDL